VSLLPPAATLIALLILLPTVTAATSILAAATGVVWLVPLGVVVGLASLTVLVAGLLGFTNVGPAAVTGGRLLSPWGDLGAVDGTPTAVLVRPEGVHLDPSGPIRGIVVASTFAGARARIRVTVEGAPPLDAEVPGLGAPAVATAVRLRIDRGAVHPLSG